MQSRLLVWVVGTGLAAVCIILLIRLIALAAGIGASRRYHGYPHEILFAVTPWVTSLTFGLLVWALRAATPAAALHGALICLVVTAGTQDYRFRTLSSGLSPLIVLFVLTFLATRLGRARKQAAGLAEQRRGRNAAQVIANLGLAGLVVPACWLMARRHDWIFESSLQLLPALLLAALCEATADTVSSEIGQAFGGRPILLTTLRAVDPGTDGAVTLLGTVAGILAAALVAAAGMGAMRMTVTQTSVALAGGVAGLFFDSLLGATVERKGWLGNELVNFSSTVFAVLIALALLALQRSSA